MPALIITYQSWDQFRVVNMECGILWQDEIMPLKMQMEAEALNL